MFASPSQICTWIPDLGIEVIGTDPPVAFNQMQAWHRFPARISHNKLQSLTSFQQFRTSVEAVCASGGTCQDSHGLDNVARVHISPSPRTRMSRDSPHAPDVATHCVMSGGDKSAAAVAAASSIPQAELCATNAECVTVAELGSAEGLAKWLEERIGVEKPSVSSWGVDSGTKRIGNLWTELVDGEISLEDSKPPKRTVHVAVVKIRNEAGMFLIESSQEMDDGRMKSRNRPLSEKMRPGENVEDACRRGVFEELGPEMGARDRVEMILETYQREEEERDSFSYPGLLTRYVLHSMVASVRGLPSSEFCTEENEGKRYDATSRNEPAKHLGSSNEAPTNVSTNGSTNGAPTFSGNGHASGIRCAIGVKKHYWKWVTDVELDEIMKK